ncbi:MAG TPA: wax ester/triacylglycerol synthase family O-acyltransferase [Solirubrobacteraceae bacterium]|nr:wax ester/triacylglycerol synthase family O-acyltransferase [Solirubrobacteraceae bacterium]
MSTRLSTADTAWLHMDRPTNLMVINSVELFDEPPDWERVKQIIQTRLVDRYPRFRQRVVESRLPLRPARWEGDPDFSLEHHVHRLALPAPGDQAALQELVGDLMTMPLDRNRPLWHTYLVEGFGEGAAIINRMHHCIADGIALARVMLSLTDADPDAGIGPPIPERPGAQSARIVPGLAGSTERLLAGAGHAGMAAVRHGVGLVTSPSHAASLAGAIARDSATAARLLLTRPDAASAIKGDPGISRRVAWGKPLSLEQVKEVAHSHDATVNDVLMAALSGGLRHYLRDRGTAAGEIQAMVPFNLRPLDQEVPRDLGNKFGLVFLPLPVGVSGSYRRLLEVHKRMTEIKAGRDGPISYALLSATGLTPEPVERRIVDLFTGKGTAIVTNVPGPSQPVYLAGTPVRAVLVWAPTSGHIGMSVSIFSYRGEVTVGLMVDATLIPDPEHVVAQLERELEAMAHLAPRHPRRPAAVAH